MPNKDTRHTTIGQTRVELVVGNLVTEDVDAIVNPAQKSLFPGGGVDGEIHEWGGPTIWEQCRDLAPCLTGEAKITTGGDLRARFVIHTVGPIWSGGQAGEAELLASCYRRVLEVARENDLKSVAFPAISTGNYVYPLDEAAQIAVRTVADFLTSEPPVFDTIRFVVRNREAFDAFSGALDLRTLGLL